MSDLDLSLCRFTPFAGGLSSFVLASVPTGFSGPNALGAINAKTYRYWAVSADGTQFENGSGVWTVATQTLTRVTINSSSAQATGPAAAVNFATIPTVDVFSNWTNALTAEYGNLPTTTLDAMSPIPSGTLLLFQQSVAPVGWTKQTAHDDKALRVVAGTASSGGSNAFSTVMAQTVVGGHTLSIGEIPSHSHTFPTVASLACCGGILSGVSYDSGIGTLVEATVTDSAVGGGAAHNHSLMMSIEYVDVIICQKN